MEYPAKFEAAEEGGYVITFPDFGWGVSQGDAEEDSREMAADLLQTLIQEHIDKAKDIPRPSKLRGKQYRIIALPARQAAKAKLYVEFQAAGIRKTELARRMGISKTNVDRLFDLGRHSQLDLLEAAFRALGKVLAIEVRDAA